MIKRFGSLLLSALMMMTANGTEANKSSQSQTIDFGGNCGACDWFVVLDGVMGGRSTGEMSTTENSIVLEGQISLENNGGFASVRNPYGDYDLSPFTQVTVRYRSSGQDFSITLNNHRRFFRPRFKAPLPKTQGEWQTVTIPFTEFKRVRLGEPVPGGPPTIDELASIIRYGVISNEKLASEYRIEIDSIRFD